MLETILTEIWADLTARVRHSDHSYRNLSLATVRQQNGGFIPSLRTVVLRGVNAETRQIMLYSDVRAAKIAEIKAQPAVSLLFYDPVRRIQIRAEGLASVHYEDELAEAEWQRSTPANKVNYSTTLAPATPVAASDPALYYPSDMTDLTAARANFAVIVVVIHRFDYLQLGKEHHLRAEFVWNGDAFVGGWVVP